MSERMKNFLVVLLFLAIIGVNVYVFISPYLPKRSNGLNLYFLPNIYSEQDMSTFLETLKGEIRTKVNVKYSEITDSKGYSNLMFELVKNNSTAPDVIMVYDEDDLIPGSRESLSTILPKS